MILRPYQSDAVTGAMESLATHDATLLVMPTGTGKTIVFSELIKQMLPLGRAMVIAHREELLEQARDKIASVTGVRPDLEMADSRADEGGMYESPIIVSSVQTQCAGGNGGRMKRFDPSRFSLLVIDEAHHAPANTYQRVVDHYRTNPNLKVIGVTATPDRHDEQALGQIFDTVGFDYEIVDAIEEGWLVPIKQHFLDVIVDFGGVPVVLGDFNGKALRALLAEGKTLEKIASDTIQWAEDRRTLVFSDSIQNAETITEAFNRDRIGCAKIVTGETPKEERRTLIADYRNGRFQYLVNVGVATEGFDVPEIACVCMARPTLSRSLYCQMAGRGTRPLGGVVDGATDRKAAIAASNKPDLLILDIVGNSTRHKLIHIGDILGGNYGDDVIALADDIMREGGVPMDVAEALAEAQRRTNLEIEAAARQAEALRRKPKSSSREIDPFGVFGIQRRQARGWEIERPINDEQRAKLEKWGIDGIDALDYSQAEQLIHEFRNRVRRRLCTYKQQKLLVRRWGMTPDKARHTSFDEAHRLIDILAANNWHRPREAAV